MVMGCGTCGNTQNPQSFPCNNCTRLGYLKGVCLRDHYTPDLYNTVRSSIEVQCEKCASKEVCESRQESYRKFCKDIIASKIAQEDDASFLSVQIFCKYFTKNKNAT